MPKSKVIRKPGRIDMTAMCDVAFLLLTFFMLTAKMKQQEPVTVDTPSSISETKLPGENIMTITVDKDGHTFFNIDSQTDKLALIEDMNKEYNIGLTEKEKMRFAVSPSFGVPRNQLKGYLDLDPHSASSVKFPGIPADTTLNELQDWVYRSRLVNPELRIVIKADKDTKYPMVSKVISTLQAQDINQFSLITGLEGNPNKPHGEPAQK